MSCGPRMLLVLCGLRDSVGDDVLGSSPFPGDAVASNHRSVEFHDIDEVPLVNAVSGTSRVLTDAVCSVEVEQVAL